MKTSFLSSAISVILSICTLHHKSGTTSYTNTERHDESFLSNNITLFGYDVKCVNCKSYIASFHSCCSELLLSYILQVFPYQRNCIISPLILPGASFPRILWSKLYSFTATQPVILRTYVYTMYRFLPKVVCKKCIESKCERLSRIQLLTK